MECSALSCARESGSSSSYKMNACDTNSYAMAPKPAASASSAAWRKRCNPKSGNVPAIAVAISWTNWKTLRAEYWRFGASGWASAARIARDSASARKTSGTSVWRIRPKPPDPKCLRTAPSTRNNKSVSSCAQRWQSRATCACSRARSAAASSSSPPLAAPSPPAGASAPGSSRSNGWIIAKSFSTASTESMGSPAARTRRTTQRATSRRRAQGRYIISGSRSSSCKSPASPRSSAPSGSRRHSSSSSASASSSGGGGCLYSGCAALRTASTVPRQWFT
mmetsp:Transcript_17317/g.51264  ORF Transcript_17317/g.51264 Transcript_17317/m.51264 type:complete len:279 (-) Transcript_17317:1379-2215(-)